ncbi:MAG: tetratricopeptide repeat protein [Goleter apudmare HA4340-LM2]|jgi:serine/threonine protein kinase|nr:tetratricopeptide repeat protein [Goleter apudmare HA4340-LM2]
MTSYCINPFCTQRENLDTSDRCVGCGTTLLINNRIRLIRPLKELTDNPDQNFDVFEVDDAGTEHHPFGKRRIMKVLKWNTSKLRKFIEQEYLALQLIEHPNIPKSYMDDFFTFTPTSPLVLHCLIMDKIEGINLEEWISLNGRISQELALEWLKNLAEILDTIHRSEFFHRDIKPSNIILQPNGQLTLVDFGAVRRITNTYLSKVSEGGGTDTGRGGRYEVTVVISPRYTPLEQIEGQAVPQSDFFALGRTFVRLCTATKLIDLPADEKTGRLNWRDKVPQIDKPFADFIDELMAFSPGKRPQTAKIILERLEKIQEQNKFYRLTKSRAFKISVLLGLLILGAIVNFKILLPIRAKFLVSQGEKAEAANNSQSAQDFFDSAIKINSQVKDDIAKFYFNKASRSTKNLEDAKRYYEISIKYNNQDADAYANLAFVCQLLNNFECAITNYSKALQLKPTWEGYFGLGTLYDDQGKKDLAEQQYNLALEINSQAAPVFNNLSRLKNIKGDYDAAIILAMEGLKETQKPELQAALYKNLGWAKLKQKMLDEAEQYLKKAEKLDPQRADIYCLMAQIQDILGNKDNSFLSWEACMTLNSEQPEVFGWRQDLLQRIIKETR